MPNTPINIQQDPHQVLLDSLNQRNQTNILLSDVDFSDPTPISPTGNGDDTEITLSPKVGSSYYNSRSFTYKRMHLNILNDNRANVIAISETTLHQLLPEINRVFGIYLTVDDVEDTDIPLYDPTLPNKLRVINVIAKPTSVLFVGSTALQVSPKDTIDIESRKTRYYVFTTNHDASEYGKTIVLLDKNGREITDFVFGRNITEYGIFSPTTLVEHNSKLYLHGVFNIKFNSGVNATETGDTKTLIINKVTGEVLDHTNGITFNNEMRLSGGRMYGNVKSKSYIIDTTDALALHVSRLYRYKEGNIDDTFTPNINYKVESVFDSYGSGVVVSSEIFTAPVPSNNNIPGKQIVIDRLDDNGAIDTTFNRLTVTGVGLHDPLKVTTVYPIIVNGVLDGYWILFNPVRGLNTTTPSLVVNGISIVPGTSVINCAFNPIIRIDKLGNVINDFNPILLHYKDEAIYDPVGSNMVNGRDYIVGTNDNVSFLTHRRNPISAFLNNYVIKFNSVGIPELLTGADYILQFRFMNINTIKKISDNNLITFGKVLAPNTSTTTPPVIVDAVVRVSDNGSKNKLLYINRPTTIGSSAIISDVLVDE